MRNLTYSLLAISAFAVALSPVACSSTSDNKGSGGSGGSGATGTGGSGNVVIGNGGSAGGGGQGGKLNQTPPCTQLNPAVDGDGDGFTPGSGDCNDCTAQMNPAAYDYPGNTVDEDCNGTPDDEPIGCDTAAVDVGYGDPVVAAQVIGICRMASATSWGLVSAKYVMADGTAGMNDLSHGLLSNFGPGVQPREGTNLLALSSGTARRPSDPGFLSPEGIFGPFPGMGMNTTSSTPPGWPKDSPSCAVQTANDTTANDPAALEVVIKTPSNANELSFDFNFYTYEFPEYVCTQFNDFFVALVNPAPQNAQDGNVSFDSQGNPVSVNNGFLEVCNAQSAGGKNFPCALGPGQLQGTGYDEPARTGPHAATGWLNTRAPVPPGQNITIRFAIWDMGDHILDSTVLVDNVTWDVGEGDIPTTVPVPQ
jgi:hypothetical protein